MLRRINLKGVASPLVKGMIFAAVTLLATAVLGVTIANRSGGETVNYRAHFTDATSLNPGDDVRMAGVRVGQVEQVRITQRRLAEVEFTLDATRALAAETTANIRFRNLIGQRYVALEQPADRGGDALEPDALIPLERTAPALDLTALFNGFKPLLRALSPDDVNTLSFEIVQLLQGEGGTVDSLLRHTASLTSTLAEKDEVIGQVVSNLNAVLDEMNDKEDELSSLISTTQQLVSGLAADAAPIGEAVAGLAAMSESTAGLLRDGREPLRDGIDALGEFAGELNGHTPEFERFLANLPRKYNALGRSASYGGWLNLYLCEVTADVPPAQGGQQPGRPLQDERCRR
jgi:phospholipid/cholesterol/gamma-HCH transport system substrate-binding protein